MKLLGLADRNLKEISRDPISMILGLLMPIFILFLFASINKRVPLEIFTPELLTPGVIVFGYSFFIMFAATLLAKDRQSAFLIRLYTTPLRPTDYILSYILPFFPLLFLQTVVCFVAGLLMGATFTNLGAALVIFLLLGTTCISVGVLMGAVLTIGQVSAVGSLLITIISLLSGAWMDLKMVGGIFEQIGYYMPFAHAVDAARAVLKGGSLGEASSALLFLGGYALTTTTLAVIAFRSTMRKP